MLQLPNDSSVDTPVDSPVEWESNWRYAVASAWSEHPYWYPGLAYEHVTMDCDIHAFRACEAAYRHGGLAAVPDRLMPYLRARDLFFKDDRSSTARFRLEALLLTSASYATITRDLFGSLYRDGVDVVQAYSRMFFDARDCNGDLVDSSQRREWLSIPPGEDDLSKSSTKQVLWKHIAHVFGYQAAAVTMRISTAASFDDSAALHGMIRQLVQSSMIEKLLRKQVDAYSAPEYMHALTSYEKMRYDVGKGAGDDDSEAVKTVIGLVNLLKPKRLIAATAVDGRQEETDRIKNKIAADLEIKKHKLLDQGAQSTYAGINKLIEAKVMSEDAL